MFIADLHIHSHYSRATSRDCVPEQLDLWARRKGIHLVGTGDFTHAAWREELAQRLEPSGEGFYRLRPEHRLRDRAAAAAPDPRFVVTGEISSIYKKNGRVRKVHNVILLPSLEAAAALSARLEGLGCNLHSDGRPILGLDSRDLLELTLDACPEAVFIPAHIWTPHFSLFGAFSGFDTIEECFEDLTPHIHALETGLSSDPPMNWRLSALDRYFLVSNSDAHSPAKLGREANLFDAELSWGGLSGALSGGGRGPRSTIEFFPEEGKYHFDGHRNCGLRLTPAEAEAAGGVCPVCGRKLTTGVLHRVEQLADREEDFRRPDAAPFERIVPLPEIIGASVGRSAAGAAVERAYEAMLAELGPEFSILCELPLEDIRRVAGPCVAEGVRRVRAGELHWEPGFDGEYGRVEILSRDEIGAFSGQLSFGAPAPVILPRAARPPAKRPAGAAGRAVDKKAAPAAAPQEFDPAQRRAVEDDAPAVAVIAGPGTGKTRTLVGRAAHLIEVRGAPAAAITAVTFTNKAAAELRARLEQRLGKRRCKGLTVGTFHAIALRQLAAAGAAPALLEEAEALRIAAEVLAAEGARGSAKKFLAWVSEVKNGRAAAGDGAFPEACFRAYADRLAALGACDFDDLLLGALRLFEGGAAEAEPLRQGLRHLLIDEFQDIDPLQYRLVQAWSAQSESVFIIGDPDQSIYRFRGAEPGCFDRFLADHGGLVPLHLDRNYRSSPEVLACAAAAIARNPAPAGGRALSPQRPSGPAVRLLTAPDELAEAIFVAKEVARMAGGVDMLGAHTRGRREQAAVEGFSDIAVLCRTHRQLETVEYALATDGIPYLVTGREAYLSDPAVRGALGFFRALSAPGDLAALRACLTGALGASPALADEVLAALAAAPRPAASDPAALLPDALRQTPPLQRFAALARQYASRLSQRPQALLESWITDAGQTLSPALDRLLCAAADAVDLGAFLQNLQLGEEADLTRPGGKRYPTDAVRLMTLHAAKGLEFPVVFLCGLSAGVLPYDAPGRPADLEEERRLFYVGVTRAQRELLLLAPGEPSPFLAELEGLPLQRSSTLEGRRPATGKQLSLFEL